MNIANNSNDSWIKSLGFFGLDMVIDKNNCIYVIGAENFYSGLGYWYYGDLIIIKYNSTGDQLWRVNMTGLRFENSKIAVDSKSNLYLATMYENRTIIPSMLLFKFNSSGSLMWQRTWNGGNGDVIDIATDCKDDIYIYGTSDLAEAFKFELFIAKYNSSGDQQWYYLYGETEGDYEGRDMVIDKNNNVIVSGFNHSNGDTSAWIKCYNQSGNLKWEITSEHSYYRLAIDSLDNLFAIRKTYITKYNNSTDLVWVWEHKIQFYWQIFIAFDSHDNIYATTIISIPEDHYNYDLYLMKINSSGDFDWYLTWGGTDDEDILAIVIDSNDSIYLLSDQILIKNPENNGKSLTNEKLWNFYMIMFSVCFCISAVSLIFIVKRRIRKKD
ncbi:MAG: hypothetical protein ACFFCV_20555 [Promethearchaeota archaeon]